MYRLALLGDTFPSQVRVNARALEDLEAVWVGASLERFRLEVPALQPQVLALDFQDLTAVPVNLVPGLLELTGARHALITYRISWPPLVDAIGSPRVSFLRGPLPLSLLRTHLHRELAHLAPRLSPAAPRAAAALPRAP